MFSRQYSLRKSQKVLHWSFDWLQKKKETLGAGTIKSIEEHLRQLEDAVFAKDKTAADKQAKKVEELCHVHFKKTTWEFVVEITVAIVFALIIATVIRQMWFELYEIPSGSMRPSFREQDRLTVTKTAFGLNVPLKAKHFLFNPDLVERGKVVIFSGEDIDLPDTDTRYFYILPYKKQYVKRLIGKPGDRLYFYGGKIYGIDKQGNPIKELLDDSWMTKLDHIPFIDFEGRSSTKGKNQISVKHMNQPIAKLKLSPGTGINAEFFDGAHWKKEQFKNDGNINSFGQLWGINNFGKARILTKNELQLHTQTTNVGEAPLYLQIRHNPNLTYPAPSYDELGFLLPAFESIIPIQEGHLKGILKNLYTARFTIKNGRAYRYSAASRGQFPRSPRFEGIEDGTYEFYNGILYQVGWKGKLTELPKDHPLLVATAENVQKLFNLGIDLDTLFVPYRYLEHRYPNRYAYFNDGDLYLMGAPIYKKNDPTLIQFVQNEQKKKNRATRNKPYLPFVDNGSPIKNGALDAAFIKKFGIQVPEEHYLVLGDNHAMSSDSRIFGFVPESNLQGAPSLILWPSGDRWGLPPQTAYPFISFPRAIVWALFLLTVIGWEIWHRKKASKRLFN